MKKTILIVSMLLFCLISQVKPQDIKVYEASKYGLLPDSKKNASPLVEKMLRKIKTKCKEGDSIVIRFGKGRYDFYEKGSAVREYYISNHDQEQPKKVGIALEDMKN